jgi:hypothetical protein
VGEWISVADEMPVPGRPVLAVCTYPHHGTRRVIRARLRQKLSQAERGQSNLPAIAAVVGFRAAFIAVERLESADE